MTTHHIEDNPRLTAGDACAVVILGAPDISAGDTLQVGKSKFKVLGTHKRCLQDVYVSYVPLCGYKSKDEFVEEYRKLGYNQKEDFRKLCMVVFVVKV